ncbi:MAG: extracellular solute-binding protein [Lachnospiraceae bacterium]|nr:extracellular solute-binding protein [Lachnospiraceae bacterium]
MNKKNGIGAKLYITLCFAFFYLPILVTMFFSFNSSKSLTHFTGFSFRWYEKLIHDNSIMSAVYVSISIAIMSTIISTVLGTITAIGLSRSRKILKEWILNVNNFPIMNPDIVTAIGLMIFFSSLKIEKGYIAMLLSHIAFCTPYVITSVYPKVRRMDHNLANAAMDLGATPFQALTKVVIPMLQPGIFAGMLLAFTMSLDDFVVSYFVTGNGVENISIVVYNMSKRINPTINALSTILIVVVTVILVCVNVIPAIMRKNHRSTGMAYQTKAGTLGRRVVLGGGIVLVLFIAGFSFNMSGAGKKVLKVYNAGEYIDKTLLDDFEKKYNCKVIYETFDSNESMYTKLQSGEKYDVLVPSDYMIERLIKEKYLQPIDWSLITNRGKVIEHLWTNEYDPKGKYTVPYFWGGVGIVYDRNVVDKKDLEEGWDILLNEKYKGNVYMYDSERDSFMIALKALGYSMNTKSKKEYEEAYEWLIRQRDTMDPVYVGDDVMDNMISGNKAMAVVYSGDGAYVINENDNLDFFLPNQGTNEWCDCMVITKDCKETTLANQFINFMLEEDVSEINEEYVGYDSAVKSTYEKFRDDYYLGNSACAPKLDNPLNETFRYQETELKQYCASLWTKVKSHQK